MLLCTILNFPTHLNYKQKMPPKKIKIAEKPKAKATVKLGKNTRTSTRLAKVVKKKKTEEIEDESFHESQNEAETECEDAEESEIEVQQTQSKSKRKAAESDNEDDEERKVKRKKTAKKEVKKIECITVKWQIQEETHPLRHMNEKFDRIELTDIIGFNESVKKDNVNLIGIFEVLITKSLKYSLKRV